MIFDSDRNTQRFFSFALSLILVNILYFLKELKYFILFQYFVFVFFFIRFWPIDSMLNDPSATTVLVLVSFVIILLGFLVRNQNKLLSFFIILSLITIGFYFENNTLILSLGLFTLLKLIETITSLNILSKNIFHSFVYPLAVILIVIYFGYKIQNPSILGFRDYFWSTALFGSQFTDKFVLPMDVYKQLYILNLMDHNVHSNFVGLFSRLHYVTAIGCWALLYYIISDTYGSLFKNWKIQLSLFIIISQCLFSGRSFFSLDDFSIVIWFGILGIFSNYKKLTPFPLNYKPIL